MAADSKKSVNAKIPCPWTTACSEGFNWTAAIARPVIVSYADRIAYTFLIKPLTP